LIESNEVLPAASLLAALPASATPLRKDIDPTWNSDHQAPNIVAEKAARTNFSADR
jgi:hypothetical protein